MAEEDWSQVLYANTPAFSLDGVSGHAKVLKVVDGDTFWLAMRLHQAAMRRIRVRLAKCNAPEVGTPSGDRLKLEFQHMLEGEVVKAELGKWDKYGRPLATLYYKDRNLVEIMLETLEVLPAIPEQDCEEECPQILPEDPQSLASS